MLLWRKNACARVYALIQVVFSDLPCTKSILGCLCCFLALLQDKVASRVRDAMGETRCVFVVLRGSQNRKWSR